MAIVIGIDPGVSGAMAVLSPRLDPKIFDMPTLSRKSGKTNKNFIDAVGLENIFSDLIPGWHEDLDDQIWIEEAMVLGKNGVISAATTIGNYARIEVVCLLQGCSFNEIKPRVWQKALGIKKADKEGSRMLAMRLFPSCRDKLSRKSDHNRAEALLIAEYGRRQMQGAG